MGMGRCVCARSYVTMSTGCGAGGHQEHSNQLNNLAHGMSNIVFIEHNAQHKTTICSMICAFSNQQQELIICSLLLLNALRGILRYICPRLICIFALLRKLWLNLNRFHFIPNDDIVAGSNNKILVVNEARQRCRRSVATAAWPQYIYIYSYAMRGVLLQIVYSVPFQMVP